MKDDELTASLGRCLDQMASGKTISACLAEHPAQAGELAPLLAMAGELGALHDYRLSEAARQRAHSRLLRAEVARNDRGRSHWWLPGMFAVPRLAAVLVAVFLCVLVMGGVVTASQPGDLAYGVRIAAERAPAWLARDAESRARAELGIVSRRLSDLDRTLSSPEQRVDPRTLAALVTSTEQAADLAEGLPERRRAEISARITEQARRVAQLGQISRVGQDRTALQTTAERMLQIAERVRAALPPSEAGPGEPGAGPTESLPLGDRRTPKPASSVTPQPTPRPSDSGTPAGPGPSPSAPGPGQIVTPAGPGPSATPRGLGPSPTPPGPGLKLTPPGPSPTPLGPGPNATAPGPGASPTSLSPDPHATASGPAPAATPEGPGPDSTSPDPGPGPGPGQGAGDSSDQGDEGSGSDH